MQMLNVMNTFWGDPRTAGREITWKGWRVGSWLSKRRVAFLG